MTDHSDLIAELQDRAASYRLGGPSSEHTALLLDQAAIALSSQSLSLSEALERCAGWSVSFAKKCEEHQEALREIERLKGLVAGIRECPQEPLKGDASAWKTVPVKPTKAMLDAVDAAYDAFEAKPIGAWCGAASVYAAMLDAAPALEDSDANLADANTNPASSDLSSLRKGAEVVGEAAAYDFVAGWHERQAKLFREMADDDPRTAEPQRKRAFEAAIHHAASAAALRNRAADDRRAALVSGSREDGA